MKTISKLIFLTVIWMIVVSGLYAQKNIRTKNPKWISDKGFWQIESNIHTPDKSIVYFYNTKNILVYKEHVDGVILNLNKRGVKMRLKKALETAILAWNKDQVLTNDQQLISVLFKK